MQLNMREIRKFQSNCIFISKVQEDFESIFQSLLFFKEKSSKKIFFFIIYEGLKKVMVED